MNKQLSNYGEEQLVRFLQDEKLHDDLNILRSELRDIRSINLQYPIYGAEEIPVPTDELIKTKINERVKVGYKRKIDSETGKMMTAYETT